MLTEHDVYVPALVPGNKRFDYIKNFLSITRSTGKIMLFAGDQKIEHLNADFYGKNIDIADSNPKHLFDIAQKATVGCLATQAGLISRYGFDYKDVAYLVKLNSKTDILGKTYDDPYSGQINTMHDVIKLKNNGLRILGVGYTIYLGSKYEAKMLTEAAQIISQAHEEGLVTVLWIYPRGKCVVNEKDPNLIAGATGVAACLGADFVKVSYPKLVNQKSEELFKQAILSAGKCGVICAGGSAMPVEEFLKITWEQINISGARGAATARNIHQKNLEEAVRLANAVSSMIYSEYSLEDAIKVFKGEIDFKL
jgi:fructose-bisphosphate aldolase / 6-deoxy-5-ketofructose 1-phosphate synthase